MLLRLSAVTAAILACGAIAACSSDADDPPATEPKCEGNLEAFRFPHGGDGSADPFGAKAAGQARAGKIREQGQIVQHPGARHKARVGDFVLANDRIAFYIEQEGRSSGYSPLGGDLLAIEPIGDDGRPKGVSTYNETLLVLSRQTVKPDKVSVIASGEDGGPAIVRVSGVLTNIPFLDTFKAIFPDEYGFPATFDYVLAPGSDKVTLRIGLVNTKLEPVTFSNAERIGFFQSSRSKLFTEGAGYAPARGAGPWVAFDGEDYAFAFRSALGPIRSEVEISGFNMFSVQGLSVDACATKEIDYLEIVGGGPGIDGLLETNRRAYGEPAWREVRGVVREEGTAGGASTPLANVVVHATTADGKYLTRAKTNAAGEYLLHVPSGNAVLTPVLQGFAIPTGTTAPEGASTTDLLLPARATIDVIATDAQTAEPLPVRVQIIPEVAPTAAPPSFGNYEELDGRLWQEFAVTGHATLPVPPGKHRVIVSRGYEWELLDTVVTAEAGKTTSVAAPLKHSVDSSGVMCADFHIHSFYSADSFDPVEMKVKSAIADGLDIPVSSEHEWVIDFQPVIQRLGLSKWAFGMPSEELTTFVWGHFGVVPLTPREDAVNNGAVDWVGRKPDEIFRVVEELPEKPVLIVNHPSGNNAFSAYFTASAFDRGTGAGADTSLWSERFGAIEVWNDSDFESNRRASVADWFALLNAGKSFWGVGSSDSHDRRTTPVGYPRTCLRVGHDDPTQLTPFVVRDVLRSGAAVVSGGLTMTVTGPGGVGPGGRASAGAYEIIVQSPTWIAAESLETIVDGISVSTQPLVPLPILDPNGGHRYTTTVQVTPTDSRPRHWVVFHAKGANDLAPLHPGKKPFAVSNPIFF